MTPQGVYEGFGIFAGSTANPGGEWKGAAYAVKGDVRFEVQILAPTKTGALQTAVRNIKAKIRESIEV